MIKVKTTSNYSLFKELPGNRVVDPKHVRELIRLITDHGNLINEFPITVNENMEVIDGQHRLAALKELGYPVAYMVHAGLTIDSVRTINAGQRNWSWRDYASSYAKLGNQNYITFLGLVDEFEVNYRVVSTYLGVRGGSKVGRPRVFEDGDLKLSAEQVAETRQKLVMLKQAQVAAQKFDRIFPPAFLRVSSSPLYDHQRMLDRLEAYGSRLKGYSSVDDYLRALEDAYNFNIKDTTKIARLF